MSLYQRIEQLDEKLAKDVEAKINRVFAIFKRHCRNYERKVRLVRDFEKQSVFSSDKIIEYDTRRIERFEKIELLEDKREKRSLLLALKELEKELKIEKDKRVAANEEIEVKEVEVLIRSLNRLYVVLEQQLGWFRKYRRSDRFKHKEELINLVKEEGRLLFGIEEHDLEELRKRVLISLQNIKIDEIKAEEYCEKRDFFIGGIVGTVYVESFSKIPKSGVIVLPGFHASRTQYDFLCKAIANAGLLAYVIDLPAQGSEGSFNVALMSEYILHAAKIIRGYFQVKTVGLVGHSTGGIASIFALVSYNRVVEGQIYKLMELFSETLLRIEELGYTDELGRYLEYYYREIKHTILESVKEGRFNMSNLFYSGRVVVVVGISMPKRFQSLFPPALAKVLSVVPQSFMGGVINLTQNLPAEKTKVKGIARFERDKRFKGIQLIYLKIPELRPFLKYMASVKSPADYMNLLNFFFRKI